MRMIMYTYAHLSEQKEKEAFISVGKLLDQTLVSHSKRLL